MMPATEHDGAMSRWQDLEAVLRERAYRTIDARPESLLEGDGGPVGKKADLILARLIGFDDQIVEDGLRLRRVEPVLYRPIPQRLTIALAEDDPHALAVRQAEYVLQSGFATTKVDGIYAPPDVKPTPPDFQIEVLYVRYRRRR